MAQAGKNLPAVQELQEAQVLYLGWEDPLEEEITWEILAWKIPWTEEPGGLQSIGSQDLDMTTHAHWNHTHRKLVNLITRGPQPCLTQ